MPLSNKNQKLYLIVGKISIFKKMVYEKRI